MTETELRKIEERAEKATKGPLVVRHDFNIFSGEQRLVATTGGHSTNKGWEQADADNKANAQFFAHAREDIPALIARVRELEADNEALKKINIMNVNSSDRSAAFDQTRIKELEATVEKYKALEEAARRFVSASLATDELSSGQRLSVRESYQRTQMKAALAALEVKS